MTNALVRGKSAPIDTERASRRQPQGPEYFTPSAFPADNRVSSTERPAVQAGRSKNVVALDGSEPIRNPGQARKVIKGICRIIRKEHGSEGCIGPIARDYFAALAILDDVAAGNDRGYVRCLPKLAKRYLPRLSDADQASILTEMRAHPVVASPRSVGELIVLTDARRDRFKLWGVEATDMDAEARAAKLRARDRARKEKARRKAGIPARGKAVARERTLDPGASLRTLQRRAQTRAASMAKAPKRTAGGR